MIQRQVYSFEMYTEGGNMYQVVDNVFERMTGGLEISAGISECVGSYQWQWPKYDILRYFYCLLKDEGFSNRYWDEWDLSNYEEEYKDLLLDFSEDLFVKIPQTYEEALIILDMYNKAYMKILPISFTIFLESQQSGEDKKINEEGNNGGSQIGNGVNLELPTSKEECRANTDIKEQQIANQRSSNIEESRLPSASGMAQVEPDVGFVED